MKYFTMQDWIAGQDLNKVGDFMAPTRAYNAYLDSVRPELPAEFQRFMKEINIHDSRLLELTADLAGGIVTIQLDAGDPTMREGRRVRLFYGNTTSVRTSADPTMSLPGPAGYGDLGNDEVEVLDDRMFKHRMLFSSGIELAVRFATFRFEVIGDES